MAPGEPSIRFRLDARSGLPAYRQLVDQVRHAVRLGLLKPGDQLPSVREVVTQITINPNTVHRAYRDLESEGIVRGEQGRGTFVARTAVGSGPDQRVLGVLQVELEAWIERAREAGLEMGGIEALVAASLSKLTAKEPA